MIPRRSNLQHQKKWEVTVLMILPAVKDQSAGEKTEEQL